MLSEPQKRLDRDDGRERCARRQHVRVLGNALCSMFIFTRSIPYQTTLLPQVLKYFEVLCS